jgi:hypothetical protein
LGFQLGMYLNLLWIAGCACLWGFTLNCILNEFAACIHVLGAWILSQGSKRLATGEQVKTSQVYSLIVLQSNNKGIYVSYV